jgi:hypothetical protein
MKQILVDRQGPFLVSSLPVTERQDRTNPTALFSEPENGSPVHQRSGTRRMEKTHAAGATYLLAAAITAVVSEFIL